MNQKTVIPIVLLFACAIARAQNYSILDLGALSPTAINTWGQVAGNYNGHAYLWTPWDGRRDLGILGGGTFSRAAAINDFGMVVGVADGPGTITSDELPPTDCSTMTQPFVWTPHKGMLGLGGTVYAGENDYYQYFCQFVFYASDIDIHGRVIGSNEDFGTYKWGFLWIPSVGMSLYADAYETSANGINNSGQVAGQTSDGEFYAHSHAALWNKSVKTDLGTLGGDSTNWSYCSGANGGNDRGQVVGWSTIDPAPSCSNVTNPSQDPVHAFFWMRSLGMQDLGTLPGDTSSVARKINFFGQVIGMSGNIVAYQDGDPGGWVEVTGRPFVWTRRDGMQNLNALISSKSGWILNSVTGINLWGQIVGSGTRNGQSHGFLLTPESFE